MVQTSTDGFLILGLSDNNKYKSRSKGISHRFMRIKNKIGFEKKIEVFHSFWATLSELMENAGVSENFTARIVGHKLETMTYGHYSGGIHFKKAVEAMAKVKYKRAA